MVDTGIGSRSTATSVGKARARQLAKVCFISDERPSAKTTLQGYSLPLTDRYSSWKLSSLPYIYAKEDDVIQEKRVFHIVAKGDNWKKVTHTQTNKQTKKLKKERKEKAQV